LPAAALVAVLLVMLGAPASAPAATDPGCTALGGNDTTVPGECQVSAPVTVAGTVTLGETLHMLAGGVINVGAAPAGGLTLNITSGNLVMEAGSLIDGNVAGSCPNTGRNITVSLTTGNVDVKTGATIRSNGCSGGFIQITTSSAGLVNIDGTVESVGTISGVAGGFPGGGPITVKAGCDLTVSDTGLISSRGQDPGADLVHLEGCVVTINGRVESTGGGHAVPNNPATSCSDLTSLSPRRNPVTRPGKPQNSTGCVEIWSGTTLTIDSTPPHKGEVNADIGTTGGVQGRGWIDLLANGTIEITDGTGNDRTVNFCGTVTNISFAVHANGGMCQSNDDGGLILIQSYLADVIASGNAIQADGSTNPNFSGGIGGEIRVEAASDVTFTANIFARGDFTPPTSGAGGKIGPTNPTVPPIVSPAPIRAFNGALSWTSGSGDARPTGSLVPIAQRGEINLQACTGVNVTGATFPVNGVVVPPYPNILGVACGGAPTVPPYVTGFPSANCLAQACQLPAGIKRGMKFNDLNHDGVKDAGEPPLNGWEIHVFGTETGTGTPVHEHFITQNLPGFGDGFYTFTLNPGTYTVCETAQPGWTQSAPLVVPPPAGETLADCTTHTHGGTITPGPRGYNFTVLGTETHENNDFGNFTAPANCVQNTALSAKLTRVVCDADPRCAGVPHYPTLQAAYDAVTGPNEVIGMFKNTTENALLYPKGALNLTIAQCTVAKITALASTCVVDITTTDPLTIISLDTAGGSNGWCVETGGHTLKSIRASGASQVGVRVTGGNNLVGWNSISGNGVGLRVEGSSNDLRGGTVEGNFGDGVQITGNSNSLQGATVQSNTGIGISISGTGNKLKGDKSNTSAQGGSKENGGAEYCFADSSTQDLGGNSKDGQTFPGTIAGSPKRYATGCYE
jgi:hypothetical protein